MPGHYEWQFRKRKGVKPDRILTLKRWQLKWTMMWQVSTYFTMSELNFYGKRNWAGQCENKHGIKKIRIPIKKDDTSNIK